MATRAYFARRFLTLKLLRAALVAGALYDGALAVIFLKPPAAMAQMPGAPLPLPWLAALWLAMLAGLALAAAGDVRRYSAIVMALVAGRAAACAILTATAGAAAGPSPAAWLAASQGLLAVVLAASWWPLRR